MTNKISLIQRDIVPTQETNYGLHVSHKCFTVSTYCHNVHRQMAEYAEQAGMAADQLFLCHTACCCQVVKFCCRFHCRRCCQHKRTC